jgi:hypothetical protein
MSRCSRQGGHDGLPRFVVLPARPAAELGRSAAERREVDFQYVYRVSRFLHPVERSILTAHPNGEAPLGYTDFLAELGIGTIGHGLTILTPAAASQCWLDYNMADYLAEMSDGWGSGLFTRSDVAECRLIAKDGENDWFVTCQRHGNEIVHLPFQSQGPRIIGGGVHGLISDFCRDCRFPFFDPTCNRRCRLFFSVSEGFGADGLERELRALWGNQRLEVCFEQDSDPEYRYRELVVQALDAHLQMWFGEKVTRNERLPSGSVSVAVTTDRHWIDELLRFAELTRVQDGPPPRVHRGMGMSCSHAAGA